MDLIYELSMYDTCNTTLYKLDDIVQYFNKAGFPDFVVYLNEANHIKPVDAKLFIENSLNCLIKHPENKTYAPYYESLRTYYNIVKKAHDILKGGEA